MESNHQCSMSDWVTTSVAAMAATPRLSSQSGLAVGAESEGFEPPMGDKPTPVFKTGAFSQTLPTLQSVRSRSNVSVGQGATFTLNRYPGWDSNPQQIGFKPITSASWVTRAYLLSYYATSIHRRGMSPQAVLCYPVPKVGLEPTRLAASDFESDMSAGSITRATGTPSVPLGPDALSGYPLSG